MLPELDAEQCARLDRAIAGALDGLQGARREKLGRLARLLRAEARRDPRAASFMPGAWPFRAHRTLAEVTP